jgi:hypothetical protein
MKLHGLHADQIRSLVAMTIFYWFFKDGFRKTTYNADDCNIPEFPIG